MSGSWAICAAFGALCGALYAVPRGPDAVYLSVQIVRVETDGCQSVRTTDGGWAPRLRRDGTRFCGALK